MPTTLVTQRMSRELRARVLRSVRGESVLSAPRGLRPSARRWIRLVMFLVITALGSWLTVTYRAQKAELKTAKDALFSRWSHAQIGLTAASQGKSGDLLAIVEGEARDYHGEVRDPTAALNESLLNRPAIYLRLPLDDAQTETSVVTRSAESGRDALLACFLMGPSLADDKATVAWVRRLYGGDFREQLQKVEPASRLFLAMTVMTSEFGAQIQRATSQREIRRLETALDQAKLKETRPTLDSELLILALDERKEPGTVTELDGATQHFVRLSVVDLLSKEVLFRTRSLVSPASVGETYRSRSANSLTSCRFGVAARKAWNGQSSDAPPPPSTAPGSVGQKSDP